MSETTTERTSPTSDDRRPKRTHRRLAIGVTSAAAVLVIAASLVVLATRDGEETTTAATTTTEATSPTTTTPSTTAPTTTTTVAPSAADTLAPFFAAVATLDGQLHDAAAAINAGGPPWTGVSQAMAHAVRAATLEPVAQAVPAGLPPDLLRATILVYSDLASRRFAMQSFWGAGDFPYQPIDPLAELSNGHAAAVRFDDDLAALRELAAATPPIAVSPPDSRQAAEVLLVVAYVGEVNGGCDSRGGVIVDEVPTIEWVDTVVPDGTPEGSQRDGNIDGIDFSASLAADGTWDVTLWAC